MNQSSDSISDTIALNKESIEAVKSIDGYYLVPCKKPQIATTSDEELMQALNLIDAFLLDALDCWKRHNGLIEQVK